LFRSDGTTEGTYLLRDINPGGSSQPYNGIWHNGIFYFSADDNVHGEELWKTDGTPEGTTMVKDIRTGSAGSVIDGEMVFENILYFTCNDGIHGNEIYRSDGTEGGTFLLKDIDPINPASLVLRC
jgi:ELWxxDGT repeat protein